MRLIDVDEYNKRSIKPIGITLMSLNFNQLLAWLLGFIALNLINKKDGDQKDIDVI